MNFCGEGEGGDGAFEMLPWPAVNYGKRMTEVRSRPKRKETKPGPKSLKLIRIYCGHVGHTQEHSHTHTHTLRYGNKRRRHGRRRRRGQADETLN